MQWPVGALPSCNGGAHAPPERRLRGTFARGAAPRVTVFRVWSSLGAGVSGHRGGRTERLEPLGETHTALRCDRDNFAFYIIIIKNGDASPVLIAPRADDDDRKMTRGLGRSQKRKRTNELPNPQPYSCVDRV
eukprot:3746180-Prymnesium_polylepis.1